MLTGIGLVLATCCLSFVWNPFQIFSSMNPSNISVQFSVQHQLSMEKGSLSMEKIGGGWKNRVGGLEK